MYAPMGVAVDVDQIYITDYLNHRVVVHAKQHGGFQFQMGQGVGRENTQFRGPHGVSVDSEAGVVYVADCKNKRVCVYRSSDGSYVRHFSVLRADQTKATPEAVLWDTQAGVLYVALWNSTTICVFPR
eukprot:TRINITY_DN6494_c0_g4_i1.p2 TRINITY_DN6494_c0_g4~~TRINITY_DN6494_c0_g4_i1.p2  ORF type:complete len:128 (+),score=30.16 TRINITY_DN6494_c0_g4_i1:612-995(+)